MSDMVTPSSGPGDVAGAELAERMAAYRRSREQIERDILPLATSIDGLSFEFQASLYDLELRRGGYVMLQGSGGAWLGQITDLKVDTVTAAGDGRAGAASTVQLRLARGSGIVVDTDGRAFHDASVRPAEAGEVDSWLTRTRPDRAGLVIGELLSAPGVSATLDSGGLGRHTFMCGQSGSGKTYALGLLLERVLAETGLRIVVLDPNSDYVGLPRLRDGADPRLAERYSSVMGDVAVWRNDPAADHPLRLAFADLDPALQAAVLGLDPIRDREEYAALVDLLHGQVGGRPLITGVDQLLETTTPGARQLGMRAINLGVLGWQIWSPNLPSLVEALRNPTARCTVVDLGSLDTIHEQRLVAEATLSTLWESRLSRLPTLIVIDEAHNICPADPTNEVSRLSSDQAVQIAAEGRKYGLYLLTSTQRPQKVHENVVSQCDNLLLMRMNSQADLADLDRLFSFVPPGLMAGATSFRLGQALVAGKLLPQAAYVQLGERISQEGGADVPATWAAPRSSP
ncbi:MAG TPA: ATP-binding protein [Kribbella sp.]|nr:ATP-binding protein [Kribbella sp.]